MRKIIITGPECSGKTELAIGLSTRLAGLYVPEVARSLLTLTANRYNQEDLCTLATYQKQLEVAAEGCAQSWVICDTSMLVYKVWSQYKYGTVHSSIEDHFTQTSASLWILCAPLTHWRPDVLRTNQYDRDLLFALYEKALVEYDKPYISLPDLELDERLNQVVSFISELELL